MEFTLKTISKAGIPEAISKAELYRSLNEPEEAESICRDILAVEPEHQLALRLLGLAITEASGPGTWQYQVGAGWQSVPPATALLLTPSAALRFQPADLGGHALGEF